MGSPNIRVSPGDASVSLEGSANPPFLVAHQVGSGQVYTTHLGRSETHGAARVRILHPHLEPRAQLRQAFLREAREAGRLAHPNIVEAVDYGRDAERGSYAIIPYRDGGSANELLGDRPLPAPIALRIGMDLLCAVHAAHEHCELHGEALDLILRDICPADIFIGSDGWTRLGDLGIARCGLRRSAERLAYAAPEYLLESRAGRGSDVFSVGVIVWELLTGRRPVRDDDHQLPVLATSNPELRDLDPWIGGALHRDLNSRYSDAVSMAQALVKASQAIGIASREEVGALVQSRLADKIAQERYFVSEEREASGPRLKPLVPPTAEESTDVGSLAPSTPPPSAPSERPPWERSSAIVHNEVTAPAFRLPEARTEIAPPTSGSSNQSRSRRSSGVLGWVVGLVVAAAAALSVLFVLSPTLIESLFVSQSAQPDLVQVRQLSPVSTRTSSGIEVLGTSESTNAQVAPPPAEVNPAPLAAPTAAVDSPPVDAPPASDAQFEAPARRVRGAAQRGPRRGRRRPRYREPLPDNPY